MPRPADWFQRLPDALEALGHLTAPVLDRTMLEQLLGIHRRTAIRLMAKFGGWQSGRRFLIERASLVAALESVAAGDDYPYETARRERLGAKLDELRREARGRRGTFPVRASAWGGEVAGLPPTIRLGPGRLEIACTDATDMLRQRMELAQAVSNDYETFEARLHGELG